MKEASCAARRGLQQGKKQNFGIWRVERNGAASDQLHRRYNKTGREFWKLLKSWKNSWGNHAIVRAFSNNQRKNTPKWSNVNKAKNPSIHRLEQEVESYKGNERVGLLLQVHKFIRIELKEEGEGGRWHVKQNTWGSDGEANPKLKAMPHQLKTN